MTFKERIKAVWEAIGGEAQAFFIGLGIGVLAGGALIGLILC